jgi:hypothetical protein
MKLLLLSALLALSLFVASDARSCFKVLHEGDPLKSSLFLPNGSSAVTYKDYFPQAELGMDVQFGYYSPGNLMFAPNDINKVSGYVDLGTEEDLRAKYDVGATIGTIYFSIHLDENNHFLIAKDAQGNKFQFMDPSDIVGLKNSQSNLEFTPVPHHIYLVNISSSVAMMPLSVPNYMMNLFYKSPQFNRIAKMKVSSVGPNTVGLRWDVLLDSTSFDYKDKDDTCYVQPDEPWARWSGDGKHDGGDDTPSDGGNVEGEAPGWVIGSIIAIFALMAIVLFAFIITSVLLWRRLKRIEEPERDRLLRVDRS